MIEDNLDAIAKAVVDDMRRPYPETVVAEVWDVIGEIIYSQKNLESLAKKEKLPTPLHQKPLSFEVYLSALYVLVLLVSYFVFY